jgi:uncharacterized protein (TIGR01777 family)
MKIIIAGGTGHVGAALLRFWAEAGHEIVLLSRRSAPKNGHVRTVQWDAKSISTWAQEIDGADVVINLAGCSVNCRYTPAAMKVIMDSRVDSTRVIGEAIAQAQNPPKVWLQSSTATIYAHRFDAPNDEITGIIGGDEPDSPIKWRQSIAVAKAWEKTLGEANTPHTRKVALRSAMTMSVDEGSVFDVLSGLAKKGLGGKLGSGKQYISWIREHDFCRALQFLINREDLSGAVNLASPNPLPQAEFARILREAWGIKIGLPAPVWMLEIGTRLMRTESELVLKSRRVVPTRLLEAGFEFDFPDWESASRALVQAQHEDR